METTCITLKPIWWNAGNNLVPFFYSATVQMWFTHSHISVMPKNSTNVRDHTKGFCLHPELAPFLSVSVSKPPLILSLGRLLNPKGPLPSASMNGDCTNSALFSLFKFSSFKSKQKQHLYISYSKGSITWGAHCYENHQISSWKRYGKAAMNTQGKYQFYVALNCSAWVCASTV